MSPFKKILVTLFLMGAAFVILLISRFVYTEPINENINYIPEIAEMVVIIDGNHLVEQTFEDVVLKTQDDDLIKLLLDKLAQSRKDNGSVDLGINFNSKIILFTVQENNVPLTCALFNLYNASNFKLNIPTLLNPLQTAYAVKDNVGLIVNQDSTLLSEKELSDFTASLLKSDKKLNIEHSVNYSNEAVATLILTNKLNPAPDDLEADLGVKLDERNMQIEGELRWHEKKGIGFEKYPTLHPKGFHFSTRLLPDPSENPFAYIYGDSLPAMRSFSLNLMGTEIVDEPAFCVVPNLELLVQFQNAYHLKSELDNFAQRQLIENLTSKSFTYGTKRFYFKQIDEYSIYVGRQTYEKIKREESSELLVAQGDLSALTSVESKGMIRQLLELISIYSAGKNFAASTEKFFVSVTQKAEGKAEIKGSLELKEGHYPTSEIIKLLLNGQLIQ